MTVSTTSVVTSVAVAVGSSVGVAVGWSVGVAVDWSVGVAVGSGVFVGGTGVAVGSGVSVGGTAVAVGSGVFVGSTGVAVGNGVFVGGTRVADGGTAVNVGGTGVADGSTVVTVGGARVIVEEGTGATVFVGISTGVSSIRVGMGVGSRPMTGAGANVGDAPGELGGVVVHVDGTGVDGATSSTGSRSGVWLGAGVCVDGPPIRSLLSGVAVGVVPAVRPGVCTAAARVGDAPGVEVPTEVAVVPGRVVAVLPGRAVATLVGDVDPRLGVDVVLVVEGATCGADTPPATLPGTFATGRTGLLPSEGRAGRLRSEGKVGTGVGSVSSATLPAGTSSGDVVGSEARSRKT